MTPTENMQITDAKKQTDEQRAEERALQRRELLIAKGIRQYEESVVMAIEKALDEGKYPKGKDDGELLASQFRNLVRVADTTDSPAVVKNFLRYQVGREKKWGRGKDSLADKIIQDIDGDLTKYAGEIATKSDSKDTQRVQMELIRRYLGYGSRQLKYLSLSEGEKL